MIPYASDTPYSCEMEFREGHTLTLLPVVYLNAVCIDVQPFQREKIYSVRSRQTT